jgi:hypothetical protein
MNSRTSFFNSFACSERRLLLTDEGARSRGAVPAFLPTGQPVGELAGEIAACLEHTVRKLDSEG